MTKSSASFFVPLYGDEACGKVHFTIHIFSQRKKNHDWKERGEYFTRNGGTLFCREPFTLSDTALAVGTLHFGVESLGYERVEYWFIFASLHSFAHNFRSFSCNSLLALLLRCLFIHSLAHSLAFGLMG